MLLLLRFVRGTRRSRQLQHGRVLAFAQPGELHDLTVGELQCVVMHVGLLEVDLPEPSYLLTDQFLAREGFKYMLALHFKNMLAFDLRLEGDLSAGDILLPLALGLSRSHQ